MKKATIYLVVLMVGSALLGSCKKDFLDENPKSSYTPQILTDSLSFEAAVFGLQQVVRTPFTRDDRQGLLCVMQVGTDVAISNPPQAEGSEVPYTKYNTLTSLDWAAKWYWDRYYDIITNANNIVEYAEKSTQITEGYRNRVTAEAKFYRAYAYNFLVNMYGGVPLVDKPLTVPKTDFVRATAEEINTFIISDLTFAAANLYDASKARPGRVNDASAKQLLAEAYLRVNKPDLAEQQCQQIIASGKFNLITARYGVKKDLPGDPFSDMFLYGNQRYKQGNREAIWVIEQENLPGGYNGGPPSGTDQHRRVWVPAYYQDGGMKIVDSLGGRGVARMRLSNWVIYKLYEASDMRNSKYNLKREFYYNNPASPKFGQKVVPALADTLVRFAPYTTKWNFYLPNDDFGYGIIKDHIMMRLGETYLLLAEAQLKQNKLPEAAASINVLRTRANASLVDAAAITLDFILDERARELLAEENRRMTLARTGKLYERATTMNGPFISGMQKFHEKMPIPQVEIDLNKGAKLDQNEGYN